MQKLMVALLEVAGLVLLITGCALAWPPLGWLAGGVAALIVAKQATT